MRSLEDMAKEDTDPAAARAGGTGGARRGCRSLGFTAMFGVFPLALIGLILAEVLGEGVWRVLPALGIAALAFVAILPLLRRYQADRPMALDGRGAFRGSARKRRVLKALVFAALVVVAGIGWQAAYPALREWVTGWAVQAEPRRQLAN